MENEKLILCPCMILIPPIQTVTNLKKTDGDDSSSNSESVVTPSTSTGKHKSGNAKNIAKNITENEIRKQTDKVRY